MTTNIHIVCSSERAYERTLLARILSDVLSFSGYGLTVFDTAFPSGPLARWYPKNGEVINFHKMREQVRLFDAMVNEPDKNYVIDLQPEYLDKFFNMLHDTGFDEGAREAGIGTGIFFLPGFSEDATERMAWIHSRLTTASLTVVTSGAEVGPQRLASKASRIRLEGSCRYTTLPRLSAMTLDWVEKQGFKFSWHYSGSVVRPPPEVKMELSFFMEMLRDWSQVPGWNETLAL